MSELDVDTNVDTGGSDAPPPSVDRDTSPQSDGPGSGRSQIRRDLEKGFAEARETEERDTRTPPKDRRTGQFKKSDRVGGRLANMQDSGTADPEPAESEQEDDVEGLESPYDTAPTGWKDVDDWDVVPEKYRVAIHRREQEMAKGVQALKQKYNEVDQALAPHMPAIQQHGHTPAQAITQLFAWFDALGKNPQVAFPALASSFGYDLRQFIPQHQRPPQQQPPQAQGQPQEGQPNPQQQQRPTMDPRFLQWNNQQLQELRQRQAAFEEAIQRQNQAKTEETLAVWSNGKPYFEQVREKMAYLIGSGSIPLKDGRVDLDRAYDEACWAIPEVRADLQHQAASAARAKAEAKRAAERKAQAEQAQKAIRAATSVPLNAPGVPGVKTNGQARKGKSVRQTLDEAVAAAKASQQ